MSEWTTKQVKNEARLLRDEGATTRSRMLYAYAACLKTDAQPVDDADERSVEDVKCDRCKWSRGKVCGVPYEPHLAKDGKCAWFKLTDAQPVDDGAVAVQDLTIGFDEDDDEARRSIERLRARVEELGRLTDETVDC